MKASPAPVEVDRLHLDGRNPAQTLCGRDQRAAASERDDRRLDAGLEEALRRGRDLILDSTGIPVRIASSVSLGVRKLASRTMERSRVRTAGAGFSTVLTPCRLPKRMAAYTASSGTSSCSRMRSQVFRSSPARSTSLRRQVAVGALDDEYAIVARRVDEDRRRAGRLPRDAPDMRRSDPDVLEVAQHAFAQHVVADLRHHDDGRAELGGRDRLVGALAAIAHFESRRGDRLAPDRHAFDIGHEIDVAGADDPMRGVLTVMVVFPQSPGAPSFELRCVVHPPSSADRAQRLMPASTA